MYYTEIIVIHIRIEVKIFKKANYFIFQFALFCIQQKPSRRPDAPYSLFEGWLVLLLKFSLVWE